jgi:hypothetical protein
MQLVAGQQGYADWQSQKKYPRLQVRAARELLEDLLYPFQMPNHARVPRSSGLGKLRSNTQGKLFDE